MKTLYGESAETENASSTHPANPLDGRHAGALAKLTWDGGAAGRWTATFDHGEGRARTDVRSLRFGPGRFATTTDLRGDDRQQRDRISLGATWAPARGWLDRAELLLYTQRSDVRQDTAQTRLADRTTRFPSLRLRRFELAQDNRGLEWLGEARSDDDARVRHRQVFGVSLDRTDYTGLRDGSETNLTTGAVSHVVLGERFPVRDFPNSVARRSGVFWQDEIGIGERFAVIPGLRWERYDLDARPDAVFSEDYPNVRVADIRRDAWTPKLGLRWQAGEHATWFAQYARGFRAPPFGDVTVTIAAGADASGIELTINSFLNCCLDTTRIDRVVLCHNGIANSEVAALRELYPFLEVVHLPAGEIRHEIRTRFWLRLSQGWRFFAPEKLITRLTAILDAEPEVSHVGVNYTDATHLTGTCAPDTAVRCRPETGRYTITDTTIHGPAMLDTTRPGQPGPDQPGLRTATLDEVLCTVLT